MNTVNDFKQELARLFHSIIGRDSFEAEAFVEIHDYVATVKKAQLISPPLHDFFVGEQAVWDKKYKDETSREDWTDDQTGDLMFEVLYSLFMPQFEQLEAAYDKFEKTGKPKTGDLKLQNENNNLKEYLNRIHPEIIKAFGKDDIVSIISYNPKTGMGSVRGKKFRFRVNHRKAKIFAELYKQIGEPVKREDALDIAGYDQKNTAESFLNELAKDIREATGLSVEELILNNDLTLEVPPK